jgi:hypothetical protein
LIRIEYAEHAGHEIGVQASFGGERGLLLQQLEELVELVFLGYILRTGAAAAEERQQGNQRNYCYPRVHAARSLIQGL